MQLEKDDQLVYITYLPLVATATPGTFYLDNVYNPEALDLPYFTFFVTHNTGYFRSYYQFINRGVG